MILEKRVQGLPNLEIFSGMLSTELGIVRVGHAKSILNAFDVELLLAGCCVSLAVAIMQQLLLISLIFSKQLRLWSMPRES